MKVLAALSSTMTILLSYTMMASSLSLIFSLSQILVVPTSVFAMAWSPPPPSSSSIRTSSMTNNNKRHAIVFNRFRRFDNKMTSPPWSTTSSASSTTFLSASNTNSEQEQQQEQQQQQQQHYSKYSSAYDKHLPASMVGEAVRSALRSDRGICFDFTVDRYSTAATAIKNDEDTANRLVSIVRVSGRGTQSFLNAKFSRSVPKNNGTVGDNPEKGDGNNKRMKFQLVRRGHVYETGYLTGKGRIIDRLTVLAFPGCSTSNKNGGDVEEAFLITSPGNSGSTLYKELSPLVFPMDRVTLTDCSPLPSGSSISSTAVASSSSSSPSSSVQTIVISVACSSLKDAQTSFNNNILQLLLGENTIEAALNSRSGFEFPTRGVCHHYSIDTSSSSTSTTTTPDSSAGGNIDDDGARNSIDVFLMEHTFLPKEACRGYTLLVRESVPTTTSAAASGTTTKTLANKIWENLTEEYNDKGPVGVASLEYETLRIEAGLPAYGFEMTGDGDGTAKKKKNAVSLLANELKTRGAKSNDGTDNDSGVENQSGTEVNKDVASDKYYAKANPLELHLQSLVDTDKGCYQGQEGVASLLKNKRGFPRLLYQVVFFDSENDFFDGSSDDGGGGGFGIANMAGATGAQNKEWQQLLKSKKLNDSFSNDTRQPQPGDKLFVLGSSESIQVGTITSVAEPNGMGEAMTVALALVRRPGPIMDGIKDMGLDLPRWWEDVSPDDDDEDKDDNGYNGVASEKGGSGIMRPPPLDSLHNLEVVVGGTYTVGRLRSVPSRRYGYASNRDLKDDDVASILDYERRGEVVATNDAPSTFMYDLAKDIKKSEVVETTLDEDVQTNESESWTARTSNDEEDDDDDDAFTEELLAKAEEEAAKAAAEAETAAAEAKRKAEKMELLKARAAAAMEARRKKKDA